MFKKRLTVVMALLALLWVVCMTASAAEYKREIRINPDGSGDCTTFAEAMEYIRAYMDYDVTVHIAPGIYKEKVVVPSWLRNVTFIGAGPDSTVITYDHHANIDKMGTFRTYTLKCEGSDITFRDLTIENNAPRLGQAVALHTEGDHLRFVNCHFLGNQDTVFTAGDRCRVCFEDCYIEGTTDFIFGPATALFRHCDIVSKADSYITAASTPADVAYGYVFENCRLLAGEGVEKVYLGRPWRPYASTVFVNCYMDSHIVPTGWHNWNDPANEQTARYGEYGSTGPGANAEQRASWAHQLTPEEAAAATDPATIFAISSVWQ